MIVCSKCKRKKKEFEYPINSSGQLSDRCMVCTVKYMFEQVRPAKRVPYTEEQKKLAHLNSNREYRKKNIDKCREYAREYYKNNKERRCENIKKATVKQDAKRMSDPTLYAKILEKKRQKRFNNPIRYCISCMRYRKKEHFEKESPTKWRRICMSCPGGKQS